MFLLLGQQGIKNQIYYSQQQRNTIYWKKNIFRYLDNVFPFLSFFLIKNITALPLSDLPNLKHLNLSHNVLTELNRWNLIDVLFEFWNIDFRDTFEDLSHLKQLCLSDNYLKKIETEAFSPLTSLDILIMDNNLLEDINGVLMVLVSLKYLSLVNNNVKWFDVAFFPKSVQMINIGRNKIEGHYTFTQIWTRHF